MGKSVRGNFTNLQKLADTISKSQLKAPKPIAQSQSRAQESSTKQQVLNLKPNTIMESSARNESENDHRLPLSVVVTDCVKRWFKDTLKEAKAGDINMQILVSQMYYSGYGVPRDVDKGKGWMTRASRTRSSVWRVRDKRPGYNASDSDSEDDLKEGS